MKKKGHLVTLQVGLMALAMVSTMSSTGVDGTGGSFGGGDGSSADPYIIEDVWDLQNISADLDAYYVLKSDIDASITAEWNSGAGFVPVGTGSNPFTGSLDGKNHTIVGLHIDYGSYRNAGLIGYMSGAGSIVNVGLARCHVTGPDTVGALVGYLYRGKVSNCHVIGEVEGDTGVGGLVGRNDGTVSDSSASVDIEGACIGGLIAANYGIVSGSYATGDLIGDYDTGGLVGLNHGSISNCYATGNATGWNAVGGLVGLNDGRVKGCHAGGNVTGNIGVGGLVGDDNNQVSDSFSTGNVTGNISVGGIMGSSSCEGSNNHYDIDKVHINGGHYITLGGLYDPQYQDWRANNQSLKISDYNDTLVPSDGNYTIGDVQGMRDLLGFADLRGYRFRLTEDINLSGSPGLYVPCFASEFDGDNHTVINLKTDLPFAGRVGLFGENHGGTIRNVGLIDCDVSGEYRVGGIVGCNAGGTVSNTYAEGDVNGSDIVGGLVGDNEGTVSGSHVSVNVTGSSWYVGGLIGLNAGVVSGCHASGNVTGTLDNVGGLVGRNGRGTIAGCSAEGSVNGKHGCVGGLVGDNLGGTVSESYSTGAVTGKGDSVGGLVGRNTGVVSDSYATGDVVSSDTFISAHFGGLVGQNWDGEVTSSYATGTVTGAYACGGLIGYSNGGTSSSSFWDTEASGLSSSAGGEGKTTREMKTRSTFTDAGWNFTHTWFIIENITYPILRWQDARPPMANAGPDQVVRLGADGKAEVILDGTGSTDDFCIVNHTWRFTYDGSEVELYGQTASYTFGAPGLFNVTLEVADGLGNRGTDAVSVLLKDVTAPVADAGPDQVVDEGAMVTLNGGGSVDNVGVVNFTWTFTDGALLVAHGPRPSHRFDDPGTFVITLNVTDSSGNWATDSVTVTVSDITPPIANAGLDQTVDEGGLVMFDGSGSTDNAGIANYTWTFEDGTGPRTLYGAVPAHAFKTPGVYVVTLRVTDAVGLEGTDTMLVTVRDITPPAAEAGPDQAVDEGATVVFDGRASADNVGVVKYSWTVIPVPGSMQFMEGAGPSCVFSVPGTYTVTLAVFDAAGLQACDSMTVTVRDKTPPVAEAGPDMTIAAGASAVFNGIASRDNGVIASYTWTCNDGREDITLHGVAPARTFDIPGIYVVTLNVTDAAGLWGTDLMTLTVLDTTPPSAEAGPDVAIALGDPVTLDGRSSQDDVGIASYLWTFQDAGGPVKLEGAEASYIFQGAGTHQITLTVTDGAGNCATDTVNIIVRDKEPPRASAGGDVTIEAGRPLGLSAQGSSDNVGIVSYEWRFIYRGGQVSLEGREQSFRFDAAGMYNITLIAKDADGNQGTDHILVTVLQSDTDDDRAVSPWVMVTAIAAIIAGCIVAAVMRKRRAP